MYLENHCQQIQGIAAFQPATSRVHKRCLLCRIPAPEVSWMHCLLPLLHIQGTAFVHIHPLMGGCAMGVGWAWGRHSESLLPSHQVGSWGISTGKHGPTAIAAGFPNCNRLSAQIPRALRKQRGKAMSWRGGMLGCGTGSRVEGLGLRTVSSHLPSQSPSEDILSLTSGTSDPGPRLSPDLVLSLTYDPEPNPTLTLNPGPRLTLSPIPD